MGDLNKALQRTKGIQLGVHIGIHTGLVVVGDMGDHGRQEQLALGETPNIAARIEGLAHPNTVAISEATYRLVQGYFDYEALGEQTLRGVAEPVTVYRVLQESGLQSRLEVASTRGLTPLVGRESEVSVLLERWAHAKDGHGQVILLSGEAGIGKSRLVQVLKEHVANEPSVRWECRSSPYYQNTALYPLIDLLQRALQWRQEATPEEKFEQLEQTLSQYRLPLADTMPLFANLLSFPLLKDRYPPLQWTPQRQRQKTLESIVAILLELAEREPVLFILEDLHWTDPTTLECLGLLVEQVPTAAIYTVLTCRPEFQPSWHHRSYVTDITVNRLSRNQIQHMAISVADGKALPAEIIKQLVDKTDGVPLYVEEMTKALLESGHLKAMEGRYESTGTLPALAIPATPQDSLMARLDRLVTAKAVAQYAAVIGRQFSYVLLQAVSQLDETTLQRELGRLVEAELVYQRGLPPQATYLFKHAMVTDIAYQSLLKSTRQHYHQRIAQVLEEQFPETAEHQPELLAYHYTQAGRDEQAIRYWQQAGERAAQRSANTEAIRHYAQALEVLKTRPDTPERTEQELALLIASGTPLMVTQGYGSSDVEHVYAQAYALCQKVEDSPHLFSTLSGYGRVSIFRAEYQRVRELGEQLLALAVRTQEPARFLEAHFTLGSPLLWMGELEASLFHMQKSRLLYDPQQHRSLVLRTGHDHEVGCLTYEARALWFLGYPDQALTRIYDALTRARDLSHSFSQARALTFVAFLHQYRREIRQTQECAEELLAIAREHEYSQWVSMGMIMRGWAVGMQGQVQGATQAREGLQAYLAIGLNGCSYYFSLLTELHIHLGQHEEGLKALNEALSFVDKTGERVYEPELYRLKGALLLRLSQDNHPEAESCFQKAISVAHQQQARSLELRATTSLATFWQQKGRRADARELLAPIYGWFTEGFDTADLQEAKTLLDEWS
jgi:predicted ATPase